MQHLSIMEVALLWFMRPQAESWVGRTQLLPAQAVDVEETDVVVDDILVVFVCLFVCLFCGRGVYGGRVLFKDNRVSLEDVQTRSKVKRVL